MNVISFILINNWAMYSIDFKQIHIVKYKAF